MWYLVDLFPIKKWFKCFKRSNPFDIGQVNMVNAVKFWNASRNTGCYANKQENCIRNQGTRDDQAVDDEIDDCYSKLKQITNSLPNSEITIIMDDSMPRLWGRTKTKICGMSSENTALAKEMKDDIVCWNSAFRIALLSPTLIFNTSRSECTPGHLSEVVAKIQSTTFL